MSDKKEEQEKLEIVLPKYNEDNVTKGWDEAWEKFPASIDKIIGWFKQYQVESIELWIIGVIETDGITKLVVNAKGGGGMKVVLKPMVV